MQGFRGVNEWGGGDMIFKQFYLGCLAHASYLIGDESTKSAVVVDPQRDVEQYLEEARSHDLKIRAVFLTHFHADFLAGHLELRDRTDAVIYLGSKARAEYEFTPVYDGQILDFGQVRLSILETPGHTPEGISLVVFDAAKSLTKPYGVLTGDTLFIGDVGRPDLMASIGVTADELAGQLYESLHSKLLALPDDTLLYPAHGAGSMCGKNLSTDTVSTIGTQRWYNYALQPMTKEAFIKIVTDQQPEAPAYFGYDAMLNRQDHATLTETMDRNLKALTIQEVLQHQENDGTVLDVRDPSDFAGGHLKGSINVGLNGKFATWSGIILQHDQPIVVIAEPGSEVEAVLRLGRIGFDRVAGFLEGGMMALVDRPEVIGRVDRITAATLAEQLRTTHPPQVLDVRTENEWKSGHIDDSLNIPLPRLEARIHEIPDDERVVVHCASGYRSSIAASLLSKHGKTGVMDLVGGYDAWEKTWTTHPTGNASSCNLS